VAVAVLFQWLGLAVLAAGVQAEQTHLLLELLEQPILVAAVVGLLKRLQLRVQLAVQA
jgi:hypothetical protein